MTCCHFGLLPTGTTRNLPRLIDHVGTQSGYAVNAGNSASLHEEPHDQTQSTDRDRDRPDSRRDHFHDRRPVAAPADAAIPADEAGWSGIGSGCIDGGLPAVGVAPPVRRSAKRFVLADPAVEVERGLHLSVAKTA